MKVGYPPRTYPLDTMSVHISMHIYVKYSLIQECGNYSRFLCFMNKVKSVEKYRKILNINRV